MDIEHPAITELMRTGYPRGYEEQHIYCSDCGEEITDSEIYTDDVYEYLCEDCLLRNHRKRGY